MKFRKFLMLRKKRATYPAILDDTNTVLWVDYQTNITKDGSDLVSVWGDKSGNGNDLLQAVGTNQPLQTADGILFDGVDNFMKAVAFTLVQPEFIYIVVKLVSYTQSREIFDGNSANSGFITEATILPEIKAYAGLFSPANNDLTVGSFHIARVLFNGGSSKLQVNEETATTWSSGVNNMNGFTLASNGGNIRFANIEVKEVIIRKIADTAPNEAEIYAYLSSKYGI